MIDDAGTLPRCSWHVDVHGLDEQMAERLVQWCDDTCGLRGKAVDPRHVFTSHLDRDSARTARDALRILPGEGAHRAVLRHVDGWLTATEESVELDIDDLLMELAGQHGEADEQDDRILASAHARSGDDDADFAWSYSWHVDIPGLDEEQASSLVLLCNRRYMRSASTIDPRLWCTLRLDRPAAEAVCEGLRMLEAADRRESADSAGLRELVEDWLAASHRWAEGN